MDDAKAAGPKLKWWHRPEQAPGPGQSARQAGEAAPAASPVDGADHVSEAEASGDWIVRPPQPPAGPAEPAAVPAPPAGPPGTAAVDRPAVAADPVDAPQAAGGGRELAGMSAEIPGEGIAPEAATSTAPAGPAPAAPGATGHPAEDAPTVPAPVERPAATVTLGQVPAGTTAEQQPGPDVEPAAGTTPPDPRTEPAAAPPPRPDSSRCTPRTPTARLPTAAPAPGRRPRSSNARRPLRPTAPCFRPRRTPRRPARRHRPPPPRRTPSSDPLARPPGRTAAGRPRARRGRLRPAPRRRRPRPAPPGAVAAGAPATGFVAPPPAAPGAWQQYDPWSAPPVAVAAPPRRRGRRPALVLGAVALALLAGGAGGVAGAYIERYGGIDDIKLPQVADGVGSRSPESVAGIARAALPGVVTLHVRGNAEQGTGTGFVLDRQGHILTNNHVVEPAGTGGEISVTFSGGQTARAKVVGKDGGYDLAVVQVEGVTGLHPLTLGDSDAAQVGDPVVAIGAPYDLANTVTSGIISAKQRPITAGGKKGDGSDVSYVDALQTDAPINPGNSGGPLVDAKARVIGINSAIRAADSGSGGLDGGSSSQGGSIGLGFAIPINQAKRVAEELINTGRATHPVIGVTLEMEYDGDGARVTQAAKTGAAPVTPGGPGAKAGIRPGDVITQVDGAAVHSGEELIIKVRSHRPGDTLTLTVQRDGAERSVRLTLGSSSRN
ncbi:S1C family serine protease [Streptomyces noursei]|uniref:S1C family serine protease n=1 Tax=Streptomyces noursei TaxID=1971 RepID=UPI00045F0928|nr:trypsin-like peptidase domain-containing protein [Streptomyces noursei]AIA05755.1 serine protease [Streptomyces noursei]